MKKLIFTFINEQSLIMFRNKRNILQNLIIVSLFKIKFLFFTIIFNILNKNLQVIYLQNNFSDTADLKIHETPVTKEIPPTLQT